MPVYAWTPEDMSICVKSALTESMIVNLGP